MAWSLPRRFDHDGDAIAFDRIGHGPPLVFVHGTPFSSFVWRRIAPLFAGEREVVMLDLVGYGQSTMREGQDVSLARQGVRRLELEPAVQCRPRGLPVASALSDRGVALMAEQVEAAPLLGSPAPG